MRRRDNITNSLNYKHGATRLSSNYTLPFVSPYTNYDLADLLAVLENQVMLDLNCHHLGSIVSFDSSTQLATAQVGYQMTQYVANTTTGAFLPQYIDYPPVCGPLVILGGGETNLTFPVSAGDNCVILFNDRDFDTWFQAQSGQRAPVPTARIHSFSDAVILVGLRAKTNPISNYDATRALLSDGNVSLGINPSNHKATIKNSAEGTLGTLLQNLCGKLNSLCSDLASATCTNGGPLSNSADYTSLASDISNISTQIQGLLE